MLGQRAALVCEVDDLDCVHEVLTILRLFVGYAVRYFFEPQRGDAAEE